MVRHDSGRRLQRLASRIVPLTSLLETRALEQRFGTFQALSGVTCAYSGRASMR